MLSAARGGSSDRKLGSWKLNYFLTRSSCLEKVFTYLVVKTVYRCYFHPLSSYPGPKFAASSRLWFVYNMVIGVLPQKIRRLHEELGPVVRVAPNELSYSSSKAWNDIYGFRSGKPEMSKETPLYQAQPPGILSATRIKHSHFRHLMSRGFSEAALREQEPLVKGYADLLMGRLHEQAKLGDAVDIVSWYNFFTFDVIGDLAFGEPFGCLATSDYHPWVKMIFDAIHLIGFKQALGHYPKLDRLVPYITPKALADKWDSHDQMTREKTLRRKESKVDRADFLSQLIKPENNVTDEELFGNATTLITAGSETTATVLSSVTWFLLQNPEAMLKLVSEVRSSFHDTSEINFISVNKLKYMLACLNEAMRVFPPVPSGLSRMVPEGGDLIDGKWVPGGTHVSVLQLAVNTSTANFSRPNEYIPERWMDDPRFMNDDQTAMQPFSTGPRNCIGKNLAFVEMRLILALLLFEFDLELDDKTEKWNEARVFIIWEKKPLWIRLKPVTRL
ncbi:cytochrome P450 monooxygenase-like protein [Lepidopterella palustris CBS 459.81]|uniref:Cytochrome P450 monooxygenase-like protein n=1 Tax=Lepidopterella palustris CBS 459.81 TaxID=1314670 RepID=A0A8E2J8P3_9PEZI|nr:cytochrome P450 monooxygenase-like protein [Lepidopterella palustris CBS 459.81]